jgi:hypothetical protein
MGFWGRRAKGYGSGTRPRLESVGARGAVEEGAQIIVEASNAAADGTSRAMVRQWLHAYHRRLSEEMRDASGVEQVCSRN